MPNDLANKALFLLYEILTVFQKYVVVLLNLTVVKNS